MKVKPSTGISAINYTFSRPVFATYDNGFAVKINIAVP
jgi:hypothetical protein